MEYPVKCKSCAKDLYGLVKYCPFCGRIAPFPSSAEEEVDRKGDVNIGHAEVVILKKQDKEKPAAIDSRDDEAVKVAHGQDDTLPVGASDKHKVTEAVENGEKRGSLDERIISDHGINVNAGDVPAPLPPPPPPPKRWIIGALCTLGIIGFLSIFMFMKHGVPPYDGKSSTPSKITETKIVSKPEGTASSAHGKNPGTKPRKAKEIKDSITNPDKKQAQNDLAGKPEQKDKGDAGEFKPETVEEMLNKGIRLYEKKQYAAAAASFEAVLKMVPNNSVAKYYLGKSIDEQKRAESGGDGAK